MVTFRSAAISLLFPLIGMLPISSLLIAENSSSARIYNINGQFVGTVSTVPTARRVELRALQSMPMISRSGSPDHLSAGMYFVVPEDQPFAGPQVLSDPVVSNGIIRVPNDQPTIQAAIASAQIGDTVLVSPGMYHERIDFLGKDITVGSLFLTTGDGKNISQTVIQPDSGSGVTFANAETPSAILTGFTITGGTGTRIGIGSLGGGILISRASPTIRNNIIRDNFILNGCVNRGGGIAVKDSSYPRIYSNTIRHNVVSGLCDCICNFGGGIWVDSTSNPIVGGSNSTGNNIDSNIADIGQQIYRMGAGPVINAQYNYWGECPAGAGVAYPLDQFDLSHCLNDPILRVGREATVPTEFRLDQNYPNPFNPSTTIEYQIAKQGTVEVRIYDINGRLVRTLQNRLQYPGKYSLMWDGKRENGGSVSSGIYFYQVKSEGVQLVRKMLLLK